ncbi:MAG: pseudouridine synthase [Clostridia bacterium]
MRLNKYMADCGVASRRACDKLISDGKVSINGKIVTVLGTIIDENNDNVIVEGQRIKLQTKMYYLMLHKPKGYVTTVSDDLERKTVMEFVKNIPARVYPIGRLDYDTEGLLLLTNDGNLANKLTHPSNEIPKTYVCRISGGLAKAEILNLSNGVVIDGKKTAPARIQVLEADAHNTRVSITITEGRNRQIKKMFEAVGKDVEFLKRVAVGDLHLGGLSRGEYRYLSEDEVNYLMNL